MFLLSHINWSGEQISNATSKHANYFWQGVPLNEYWNFHNINPLPFRKYLNSGLIVEKTKILN
jgi:hypothetical protein